MDRDYEASDLVKSGSGEKNTLDSYSDSELVREFKQGNEKGFDALVLRYQERIYLLAFRMVRNEQDAWDLAQEAFIRAYKALRKFKEQSSFYTWIYRICFNLCLSFFKKSKKEKNTVSLDDMTEDKLMLQSVTTDSSWRPETALKQKQIAVAVEQALAQLPTQQKLIFVMRQYDQLNNEEIAEKLNISLGGVKSNYHHAVRKLQVLLKDWIY